MFNKTIQFLKNLSFIGKKSLRFEVGSRKIDPRRALSYIDKRTSNIVVQPHIVDSIISGLGTPKRKYLFANVENKGKKQNRILLATSKINEDDDNLMSLLKSTNNDLKLSAPTKILIAVTMPPGIEEVALAHVLLARVQLLTDLIILQVFNVKAIQIKPSKARVAETNKLTTIFGQAKKCCVHYFASYEINIQFQDQIQEE